MTIRSVYDPAALDCLYNAQSIAIYGISPNPASFAAKTLNNLIGSGQGGHRGYGGRIHLINAKYDRIGERPCHPSVAALPEMPDCVLIALPAEAVGPVAEECAQAGVKSIVVFASGYAEMSQPERIARQHALTALAGASGMKILGPNCMGYMNFPALTMATFAAADLKLQKPPRPGIGIASQSGALGYGLAQAVHRGAVITHVLTTGNGCDVNVADSVAWLAQQPDCNAVVCVFEGLDEPQHLAQAGRIAWALDKPVIVHKMGGSPAGATAARSHTGSTAGDSDEYRRICDTEGMIYVDEIEAVMETASFFAKAPRIPAGKGVAVLSPSGGLGVASADAATRHGVPLPQPPEMVATQLATLIPEFGSRRNPADVTAAVAGDLKKTAACFDALAADPAYGALVFPQVLYSARTIDRYRMFSEVYERHGKPILLPLVGGWIGGPGYVEAEASPHTSPFLSVDRCFATLAAWFWRAERRSKSATT